MTAAQRDAITSPDSGSHHVLYNCAFVGELQIRLTSSWKNLHNGGDVNAHKLGISTEAVYFLFFESGDTGYVEGETHGCMCQKTRVGYNGNGHLQLQVLQVQL